jgi:hypothetical protein
MVFQPSGTVGTLEPLPSNTTTWASRASPAATSVGTSTVTPVTAVLESNNGPEATKVMLVEGVGVAVGVTEGVGVAPCCTFTVIEAVPIKVPLPL